MTEKNIFAHKTFLHLNISHFNLFLMWELQPPVKKVTPSFLATMIIMAIIILVQYENNTVGSSSRTISNQDRATFSDIIFEGHLLLLTVEVKVLDNLFYYGSTYCICFETQIFWDTVFWFCEEFHCDD